MRKCAVVHPYLDENKKKRIQNMADSLGFEVAFYNHNSEALPYLKEVEIIYGMGADLITAADNLKWFASSSAGVNTYIPVLKEETLLTNASGAYGLSISEHIIMVSLMMLRRQNEYGDLVTHKEWRHDIPIESLYGKTITCLGTGDIGSNFAQRVKAFMPEKIIGVNRSGKADLSLFDEVVTIDNIMSVLPRTDLLVMSLPETPLTVNLIDKEKLSALKDGSYLVNVGRGTAIVEEDLKEALCNGKLKAAALDVFQREPLPQDSPLWDLNNLLITPHCSGQLTLEATREKNLNIFLENFTAYCKGEPMQNVIDKSIGY